MSFYYHEQTEQIIKEDMCYQSVFYDVSIENLFIAALLLPGYKVPPSYM